MKYRKKPVVIEAIRYDGDNELELINFVGHQNLRIDVIRECVTTSQGVIPHWHEYYIKTLEGEMLVGKGDYVIRGVNGEYYPCKSDIFEKTYEAVEKE